MNLNSLFAYQKKLDERIIAEHNLSGQKLDKKKIVALLAELFECINEARFFKYWSSDQKPNTRQAKGINTTCTNTFITTSKQIITNPLLEEYADVVHLTISIANDIGYTSHTYTETTPRDLNDLTIGITNAITVLAVNPSKELIEAVLNNIISLGYQLGFNEKQVTDAYYKKNKENHRRQDNNY